MNGSQTYGPTEFLDRLKRDDLAPPVVLTGMVKPDDDADDRLLFAPGAVCASWTPVPLASIDSISVEAFVPCDDHRHPLVTLVLEAPETDEGRLLSTLLQSSAGRSRARRSFPRGQDAAVRTRRTRRPQPAASPAITVGPNAGDLNPSCAGCPAWVDDNGWFGILVDCSDTTCDYEEY